MISALVIVAIVVSVALGYKTKINTGLFAIAFAYLLGCFVLDLDASTVIKTWPISIFFVIFAVSLFYNFALVNGTLEKVALHIFYICRNFPCFLPFILYFIAALIAGLGAGYFTVMAFLAPITLLLCDKMEMDKLIGAVAVNCGALSGANFMTSGSGTIFRSLMEAVGYGVTESFGYSAIIFVTSVIFSILFIGVFSIMIRHKNARLGVIHVEKPKPLTSKQRTNLYLIIAMLVIVLAFPILRSIFPGSDAIKYINSKMNVGLVAIIMSIIALFMRLADEKQVIAKVPWSTLIMICGVGMLITVAISAGTIKLLSGWISSNVPMLLVPVVFAVVGAFMSFFSSTLGVVTPALFPLVPSIATVSGIAPEVLFTCIVIGAQSSAISPFSSGGSLTLGSCPTDEERIVIFPRLLFVAVPCSVGFAVLYSFVISFFI